MNLDTPTGDIVVEPAMSEAECAKAMAYGMMAVEPGIDVLALGEMGIGNTTAAAALGAGLFGGEGALGAGPGTGVAGPAPAPASPKRHWRPSGALSTKRSRSIVSRRATRSTCCAAWAGSSSPLL